jgi:hypothetical protein
MFNSMKIYTVHVKPDDAGVQFRPVFVKEGFNVNAFIFTIFWALYYRLWAPALALLAMYMALGFLAEGHVLSRASIDTVRLGVHVMVGYLGNDWLRSRLARQGYIIADIAAGDSFLRAQQRYLERYVTAATH